MKTTSLSELKARRAVLLRQLRRAGPVIGGSLATVARTCGNANCHCMQGGPKHEAVILCSKIKGRSVAIYVPKELREQVRLWNGEHKKIKRVLKEISEINEQIVRGHVRAKRQTAAGRRSLKVLPQQ
jgi:hypothetical protein